MIWFKGGVGNGGGGGYCEGGDDENGLLAGNKSAREGVINNKFLKPYCSFNRINANSVWLYRCI